MNPRTRQITIAVLAILTVVLAVAAGYTGYRLSQQDNSVDDSSAQSMSQCQQYLGGTESCQKSGGTNTGFVCKCIDLSATGGDDNVVVNCGTFDSNKCPVSTNPPPSGQTCTPGNVQTSACGTDGCASNQRRIRQCKDDGSGYESKGCTTDSNCSGSNPPTGTPPAGNTKSAGAICNPATDTCPSGYACTPTTNSATEYRCNQTSAGSSCPSGNSCGGAYLACTCTSLTASGECRSNCQSFSSYSAARNHITSTTNCGQVDTVCGNNGVAYRANGADAILCGNFEVIRTACGGGSTPPPPTNTPRCIVNGTKSSTEQCDPQATPTGCSTGERCNNQCRCVDVQTPVCGDNCTSNNQCPNNHTCTNGRCVQNGCTATTCVNGCIPSCGGPCDPTGDGLGCPIGHVCDPTNSRCVLNQCLGNSNCTNNGCVLPDTAIFDENNSRLLVGIFLILLGLILTKVNVFQKSALLLDKAMSYGQKSINGEVQNSKTHKSGFRKLLDKSRNKFEDKFK